MPTTACGDLCEGRSAGEPGISESLKNQGRRRFVSPVWISIEISHDRKCLIGWTIEVQIEPPCLSRRSALRRHVFDICDGPSGNGEITCLWATTTATAPRASS